MHNDFLSRHLVLGHLRTKMTWMCMPWTPCQATTGYWTNLTMIIIMAGLLLNINVRPRAIYSTQFNSVWTDKIKLNVILKHLIYNYPAISHNCEV